MRDFIIKAWFLPFGFVSQLIFDGAPDDVAGFLYEPDNIFGHCFA